MNTTETERTAWLARQLAAAQAIEAAGLGPKKPVVHDPNPDLHMLLAALHARLEVHGNGLRITCRDTGLEILDLDIYELAKAVMLEYVEIRPMTPVKRKRTRKAAA